VHSLRRLRQGSLGGGFGSSGNSGKRVLANLHNDLAAYSQFD
jgi:hypothetical protein